MCKQGYLTGNVCKDHDCLTNHRTYGVRARMRNRTLNSSPENVGYRQSFIAEAILLGKVSAWLPIGTDQHLREKWAPSPVNTEVVREHRARTREWPRQMDAITVGGHLRKSQDFQGRQSGQLSAGVWGSSRTLLGDDRSESKQRRLSVSKGTGEARSSMVVAQIGCSKIAESAPMRRPSGGAPVVVRDVNDVHMAKGCRMIRFGQLKCLNREGSR